MSFTPTDVIAEVRRSVQDTKVPYRYDQAFMLSAVNQCLRRIALIRPDLFNVIETFACTLGTLQTAPADAIRITEVFRVADGAAIAEVNRDTLDLALASWPVGATGPATDWMRHVRNPSAFFVFPPSAADQQLMIEYARAPATLATTDAVPLNDAYFPALVDCVVWWVESQDSESVSNQRAQMFQQSWTSMLNTTVQTKPMTDTESGGQPPNTVI